MIKAIAIDVTKLLLICLAILVSIIVIKQNNKLKWGVISIYALGFLYVTFLSRESGVDSQIRLVPLNSVIKIINAVYSRYNEWGFPNCLKEMKWHILAIISMEFNVLLFIPLGYLLPMFGFSKSNTLITCLLVIVLCETTQLVTKLGWFDIDDILLNMIGGKFGLHLYCKYLENS